MRLNWSHVGFVRERLQTPKFLRHEKFPRSFSRWLRDKMWGCKKRNVENLLLHHHRKRFVEVLRQYGGENLYPILFNNNLNIHDTDNSSETWKFYSLLDISRGVSFREDFQCCLQLNTESVVLRIFTWIFSCFLKVLRHMWTFGENEGKCISLTFLELILKLQFIC